MNVTERPRICVFCGARPGSNLRYLELATEFGDWLGRRGLDVVYGGGTVGLMGAVAESALAAGALVTGVVPHHLLSSERPQPNGVRLIVVRSMHERKAMMYRMADAFVALPGGVGTLDELFEISTWAKLGLHNKPAVILNCGGYFDSLFTLLDHAVREGMMTPAERSFIQTADTIPDIGDRLALPDTLTAVQG